MVHVVEIDTAECWDLLERSSVCRVAWNQADGPVVLPLNYVLHEGELWLRTSAHSAAAHEIDDDPVAVLIDDLDAATHRGWSVQVRGVAHLRYHESEVPPDVQGLTTWADGPRPLWIKVVAHEVTGRRLAD